MKKMSFTLKGLLIIFIFSVLITMFFQVNNNVLAYNLNVNNEKTQISSENVNAEPETPVPPTELGVLVTNDESGINDSFFYQYLLLAYNNYYGLTGENRATQIYTEMFANFEELVLTETNGLIKSVSGLKYLNLENLKVLNLGRNQISNISIDDLKNLNSLEQLILYDNNLTEFTVPTTLLNLKKLNLNKNYISSIDLSSLNTCEVYLSFNKISTIENITFPRIIYNTNLFVELYNNNILDADEMFVSGNSAEGKIVLELGLQGYGLNYKNGDENKETPVIPKENKLKFYNSSRYSNMQVKIYNSLTNELVLTIENNLDNVVNTYGLQVGEYKLDYVDKTTGLTMYDYLDEYLCAFKSHDGFKVIPTSPVVKFVVNGKEYDSYGKLNGTAKLVATNVDGDGKIYYKIGNGNWVEGSEVKLDLGGQYSVSFKCVIGEIGSENSYESIAVTKFVQQSLNPYVPDVAMLIIIVVIAVLLFFVALPLIIKYGIKR